jgi:hypothetical protein
MPKENGQGSTVYHYIEAEGFSESVIVSVGAFTNPNLPAPVFSAYKDRKHHWVDIPTSVVDDWD